MKNVKLLVNGHPVGGDKMSVKGACILAGEIRAAFHTPVVKSSTEVFVNDVSVSRFVAEDSGNGKIFWMMPR